jgi:glycine cleavage system H protein
VKYTKDHEWIRAAGEQAEVGITRYAQVQLGEVVFVDLPEIGRSVKAGESFGNIESVKAVSELFSPMSGEVVAVNTALKDHPELVNTEPHTTWIIKLKLTDPGEASSLLDATQYEALLVE